MKQTYQYTVNFEETEDRVILATVPALPGCVSYGHTLDEAEKNIREAIECYLEGLQEIGEEIPVEERTAALSTTKVLTVNLSAA
jgi:predicted RNase H-like HicB family nuclease